MAKEEKEYDYLTNEIFELKQIKAFLNLATFRKETLDAEIFSYDKKAITIFKSKIKIGDAIDWQEGSNQLKEYTLPITNLINHNSHCEGYVTEEVIGINGYQMLTKLNNLESRKLIAKYLTDMYSNMLEKGYLYTNWCLEDLLISPKRGVILENPHFIIESDKLKNKNIDLVDYNFCILIFNILYGLDFSVVETEKITDLNIPEIIKDIICKKKNLILNIEDLRKIIKVTQEAYINEKGIKKLIREYPINN